MKLDGLESFRVFSETLNFTRAAEARHLTQPALHKQIQNLERELGVDLYRKDGRVLFLTDAGKTVARFARETMDRVTDIKRLVRGEGRQTSVSLSAGRGGYLYLLGSAVRSFQKRYPGDLQLKVADAQGTLEAVRNGAAHLGFTVLTEPPNDLSATPVYEASSQLVVHKGHPLSDRKCATVSDLDGLPLIVPPKPSPLRDLIYALMSREEKTCNPVMEAPGWELAMHFVSLGLGATIVNGCCRPPRGTVSVDLKGFPSTIYYLIEHPNSLPRPGKEELKTLILKCAKIY